MDALETLQDGRQGAVRHLQGLDDLADSAVLGKVVLGGFLHGDIGLRNGTQDAVPGFHVADQADGFLPADGHGENRPREHDGIPQGQDGQGVRQLGLIQFQEGGVTDDGHDIHFYARLGVHVKVILHL